MMIFKNFKKMNNEMKWGIFLLSIYFLWFLCWFFYAYIFKGTFLSPYTPIIQIQYELLPPFTKAFIGGTDIYGRSLIEVLSCGLAYSLGIAFLVTIISSFIGTIMGYFSVLGRKEIIFFSDLMINLIFIFPGILISILFLSLTGQSYWGLVLCLSFISWPSYAKITKGEIQQMISLNYIESAKAIGIKPLRIFFTIILPALLPQISIHIVLGMSSIIIMEATLGFLGLAFNEFSWGVILSMAHSVLLEASYIMIILGILISGLIMALNLLGDGLRDYFDVKN